MMAMTTSSSIRVKAWGRIGPSRAGVPERVERGAASGSIVALAEALAFITSFNHATRRFFQEMCSELQRWSEAPDEDRLREILGEEADYVCADAVVYGGVRPIWLGSNQTPNSLAPTT